MVDTDFLIRRVVSMVELCGLGHICEVTPASDPEVEDSVVCITGVYGCQLIGIDHRTGDFSLCEVSDGGEIVMQVDTTDDLRFLVSLMKLDHRRLTNPKSYNPSNLSKAICNGVCIRKGEFCPDCVSDANFCS